jgi:ribosomal protein S12 methylthiotransferase accessory factor
VEPDDARLFYTFTRMAYTSRYSEDVFDCYQKNGGAGLTSSEARAAAIGESIERYSCSVYDINEFRLATWNELDKDGLAALEPAKIPLFSAAQYSQSEFLFSPFTEDTPVRWVMAWSMQQRKAVLVPATFVFVPYAPKHPEVRIVDSVSTGLACSLDPWQAILSGLCESIERDAVMITWLARLGVPRIDPTSDPELARLIDDRFARTGVEYMLFDISLDWEIPVLFGFAVDRMHDGLALATGAAAAFDARRAATKAIVEAAQGRLWLKYMRTQPRANRPMPEAIHTFEDHVRLFGSLEMLPGASFLIDQQPSAPLPLSRPPVAHPDARAQVLELTRILGTRGLDVLVIDVTSGDVAALGFHVIKVIVPGLQALNADHRFRLLGSRRLYDVPRVVGYRDRRLTEDDLNPVPHPFP